MKKKFSHFLMKYNYRIYSACIIFLMSILSFYSLWNFNPHLPVPFLIYSSIAGFKLSFFTSVIQGIAGGLLFLYGKAAWVVPFVLSVFSIIALMGHSFSRVVRIISLIAFVPFVSALCFFYEYNSAPFGLAGVVGNACATIALFYIPACYMKLVGCLLGALFFVCIGQKEAFGCIRFINKKLGITRSFHSAFLIIAAWFFYFIPFLKRIFPETSAKVVDIDALIQKIVVQDYHKIAEEELSEVVDTADYTLAQILAKKSEAYIPQVYDAPEGAADALIKKLVSLGISARSVGVQSGPRVTTFLIQIEDGIRISTLLSREDDLAYALGKQNIRIYIPAPGTKDIGIEVENDKKYTVSLRSLLYDPIFNTSAFNIPIVLGTTTNGKTAFADLATMPHVLIAGTTGSGKSVTIHSFIVSILWNFHSDHLKLLLIDPKRLECTLYQNIPHLLAPIINDASEVSDALENCIQEMRARYKVLADHRVRNIQELYAIDDSYKKEYPYWVIVIDEYADIRLLIGDSCEKQIVSICQMARAAGIHVILATQRPSVDVISGLVKANIPTRIACKVSSQVDSKIVIDTCGAEKLLGKGDMLYLDSSGSLQRMHGAYISTEEIEKMISYLASTDHSLKKTFNNDLAARNSMVQP